MAFEKLFEPIKIGDVEIKNRLAMAPMNLGLSENNLGYINEGILAYYAARAKGGVGLIITECVLGTKFCSRFPAVSNLHLFNTSHVPGLSLIPEITHAFGAKAFIQLTVGFGRQNKAINGELSPAPSPIPYLTTPDNMPRAYRELYQRLPGSPKCRIGDVPREMTVEEILSEQEEYTNSARLAAICGFDGLEIHAPHGYLEHQFLSPRSNKRTDRYGGSLENRFRFTSELVMKTMAVVKRDFPKFAIGIRCSADEHMPDGFTYEDMKIVVGKLGDLGIDYFNLSDGSHEAYKYMMPEEDGTMLEEAHGFKQILKVPVITPGIHDPNRAEQAVVEGKTDIVALGRPVLADPDWPNKVKEGKVDTITKCRRDYTCMIRLRLGLPIRCLYNPNLGREKYMPEYAPPAYKRTVFDLIPGLQK